MTEQKRGVAHHIKDLDGWQWQGRAALYRLEPPVLEADATGEEQTYEYVVVHAVNSVYGPGTFIYPGEVVGPKRGRELAGSFRGGLSHAEALDLAGYEVAS